MRVQLGLGSNVGDREAQLRQALTILQSKPGIELKQVSSCYETSPVGVENQAAFMNLVAEIETDLDPLELLNVVQCIEQKMGRTQTYRWGPREIDIDILLWGAKRVDTPALTIPHQELHKRAFVLTPLAEIVPEALEPITGKPIRDLALAPEAQGEVKRIDSITP